MFKRFAHVVLFLITASVVVCSEILGANVVAYNNSLAYYAYYYSAAAYCSYPSLTTWTCGKACSNLTGFKEETQHLNLARKTFAFSGYNPSQDLIVLAFRGTNGFTDYQNVWTDISIDKDIYPGIPGAYVHSGFKLAYDAVSVSIK